MRKFLLLSLCVLGLIGMTTAAAGRVDNACLSNCSGQGYPFRYCQNLCSDGTNEVPVMGTGMGQLLPQTDRVCLNTCVANGNDFSACKASCSTSGF